MAARNSPLRRFAAFDPNHVARVKYRDAERASRSALAFEAMAHRNLARLAAASQLKPPAMAGRGA